MILGKNASLREHSKGGEDILLRPAYARKQIHPKKGYPSDIDVGITRDRQSSFRFLRPVARQPSSIILTVMRTLIDPCRFVGLQQNCPHQRFWFPIEIVVYQSGGNGGKTAAQRLSTREERYLPRRHSQYSHATSVVDGQSERPAFVIGLERQVTHHDDPSTVEIRGTYRLQSPLQGEDMDQEEVQDITKEFLETLLQQPQSPLQGEDIDREEVQDKTQIMMDPPAVDIVAKEFLETLLQQPVASTNNGESYASSATEARNIVDDVGEDGLLRVPGVWTRGSVWAPTLRLGGAKAGCTTETGGRLGDQHCQCREDEVGT